MTKLRTIMALLACFAFVGMFWGCENESPADSPPGLIISGLPPAGLLPYAVFVFPSGTNLSTPEAIDEAIASFNYLALGSVVDGVGGIDFFVLLCLIDMSSWMGSGSLPVVLLDANGDNNDALNPMYRRATVSFTNGRASVPFNSFVPVVVAPPGLTIRGLPPAGLLPYAVFVFPADTDLSTPEAIDEAIVSYDYLALGSVAEGVGGNNFFVLLCLIDMSPWMGSGSLPIVLVDANGDNNDILNPMYRRATVNFTDGRGSVSFNNFAFVPVVYKFTVTFNSNDGEFVPSQLVDSGTPVSRPTDPRRTSFSFLNWYSDADLTIVYDFSALVTKDITLYAGWFTSASGLSENIWRNFQIREPGQSIWLSIHNDTSSGRRIYIWLNSEKQGDGTRTGNVRLTGYYPRLSSSIDPRTRFNAFRDITEAWETAIRMTTPHLDGTFFIRIDGVDAGTIAIAYTEGRWYGNTRPPFNP